MTDPTAAFTKMVPGFEFLQDLVRNAGAAMPSVGQWIAPTLNPDELEKRIEELRTVQFWLEQNARMLAATIQALEVQRMTLSTLKTMNVSVGELRDSLLLRTPEPTAPAAARTETTGMAPSKPPARPRKAHTTASPAAATGNGGGAAPSGVVDPMEWWGALTRQFTQLAAHAMKDGAAGAAAGFGAATARPPPDAAADAPRRAAAASPSAPPITAPKTAGTVGNAPRKAAAAAKRGKATDSRPRKP